jgi:hypothetical protein
MGDVRFEVVPLEALRVKPGDVLVLRLPGKFARERVEEVSETLKHVGLDGRVLIVSEEIALTVVEAEAS